MAGMARNDSLRHNGQCTLTVLKSWPTSVTITTPDPHSGHDIGTVLSGAVSATLRA